MRWSLLLVGLFAGACFSEDSQPSGGSGPDESGGTMGGADATSVGMPTGGGAGTSTAAVDTTSVADTGEATAADDETGEPECDADGARDAACPAEAPYCADGFCVACPDLPAGCADVDLAAPICDPESGACVACTEHDQCASGACRIATGECFGDENRLWVSANADCMAATGSEAAPFCTVDEALGVVMGQPGREPWAVFVAGAGVPYTLSDDAGLPERPFALVGPSSGVAAELSGLPPAHLLVSGAGQDYYLAHLSLDGTGTEGTVLDCAAGELWADDVGYVGARCPRRRNDVSTPPPRRPRSCGATSPTRCPSRTSCDEYGIQPSVFYGWQRQALDGLDALLAGARRGRRGHGARAPERVITASRSWFSPRSREDVPGTGGRSRSLRAA